MTKNLRLALLLAAGVVLMAGSSYLVWRAGHMRSAPAAASAGAADARVLRFASNAEPAPKLVIHDLAGKVTSIDDLKGKVVLVNFWATWCPPCRAEVPELIALQKKLGDKLQIIGISEDDSIDDVHKYIEKMGINYPVVMSTSEIVQAYGGVAALPTTFVVDPEGKVVQRHLGLLDAENTEAEVRALTGMPVDAKIEHFEDTGQVMKKNVENATELPDVDLSGLTPEQKKLALRRLNTTDCTCGCKQSVAQCRLDDTSCPISKDLAAKVVKEIRDGISTTPDAAPVSR
jgi:thiol-disulfide isomerase/thioredoxin